MTVIEICEMSVRCGEEGERERKVHHISAQTFQELLSARGRERSLGSERRTLGQERRKCFGATDGDKDDDPDAISYPIQTESEKRCKLRRRRPIRLIKCRPIKERQRP